LPNHLGEFNSGVLALDYSPTRSELLVYGRSLSPLYSLSLPVGSAPRRIGDYSVNGAAWAPDGQSIVICSHDALYRVKADGSDQRKLATVPGYPMHPRWSPDGKKIVFSIDPWNDLPSPLWEIDADGANPRPMLAGRENETEFYPAWSPNGKYLIYNSYPTNDVQLFAVQRKGGLWHRQATPVQLTSGPLSFTAPTFDPDGKTIYALGFLNQGELMRYDRGTQQWKPYLSGISAADADFSRDGEWVTYVLLPEATLWRSRVDGSERTQLTIAGFRVSMPRWSPDGKQIAFMGLPPGGRWTIYVISADGGQAERLVKDNKFYADPNWSPDGKRIVYGEQALNPKAIHIFDLQSRHTSDLPDSAGLFAPRWSPDGSYILAATSVSLSAQNGQSSSLQKLMIFDLNGQQWRRWCEAPDFSYPVFSRDGKYVYFSDEDASMIYRLRVGENKIEPVAKIDVPGGMKLDDFWYWSGQTPDDSPLVMRDAGTQEIYALDVDLP
jgi:Tol biopolymer transport system component